VLGGRVKKFAYCLISFGGRVAVPEAVDCMSDFGMIISNKFWYDKKYQLK